MNDLAFNWNLLADFAAMWHYSFMQHAFEAGTVVAIVAGVIGYFVVMRRSSFAAHGLAHAGFTGAAAAVLFGVSPIFGLFAFTFAGALVMASLGRRAESRDVQIGAVLAFMLALGVLFISLYRGGYATEAYSILFGEILGISTGDVRITVLSSLIVLAVFAVVYRPLLFSSLDEDVAAAKGIPVFAVGLIFMLLVAAATSVAVQVVGVLMIFALMVTPAAAASRIARRPSTGILLSVTIALFATWLGLFISFYLPYPVSFFITAGTFAVYLLARLISR